MEFKEFDELELCYWKNSFDCWLGFRRKDFVFLGMKLSFGIKLDIIKRVEGSKNRDVNYINVC